MVGSEMASHLFDDLLILVWLLDRIEQLVADVPVQRQLASARPVHRLRVIRIQHDQRDRVGAEDLEVLRGQQLETAKQRALMMFTRPSLIADTTSVNGTAGFTSMLSRRNHSVSKPNAISRFCSRAPAGIMSHHRPTKPMPSR